jgi:hypothetical protein
MSPLAGMAWVVAFAGFVMRFGPLLVRRLPLLPVACQ